MTASPAYMARIRQRVEAYDEDEESTEEAKPQLKKEGKRSDDEEDEPAEEAPSKMPQKKKGTRVDEKKKRKKNAPAEVSSKRRIREGAKKTERRDPRFDELCGKLDQDIFRKRYDFLEPDDPVQKANVERSDRERAVRRKVKKEERDRVKQGKKPFYLKKSALKQRILDDQYNHLKEKGTLNKFLKRKQRKLRAKGLLDQRVDYTTSS